MLLDFAKGAMSPGTGIRDIERTDQDLWRDPSTVSMSVLEQELRPLLIVMQELVLGAH